MGVEYNAVIMVGLPRRELDSIIGIQDRIDAGDLEVCSPYFDGDDDGAAIVGYMYETSPAYAAKRFVWSEPVIDTFKAKFKTATGFDALVWISTRGW